MDELRERIDCGGAGRDGNRDGCAVQRRRPSTVDRFDVRRSRPAGGRATLTVSPGEGHILTKITARQLFDVLEKTRPAH